MTTEHDFKKALDSTEEYQRSLNYRDGTGEKFMFKDGEEVMYKHNETIRFALRLADKLLGQEVSKDMAWKGAMGAEDNISASDAKRCFKSMLAAAVTELEQQK